ncbi:hypothetical protein D9619_011130 [Psilocybe cf. subviscida]|uniref:Uncharacterized protein n=1 Tax=Psilocybe cf. subviscida TaxID=2480587 RepID=A0A8H5BKF1_9AGAR|nr:hypothetical protein D9619_011130 [Psilocybe cf. subviscida]
MLCLVPPTRVIVTSTMWFTYLRPCWVITCGLVAICQATTVTDVLNDINTITMHATSAYDVVTSLTSPQGLLGIVTTEVNALVANIEVIHAEFNKVNGGLMKAVTDTNALSGPSTTDLLRISQAATKSKLVMNNAIAEVQAKEHTLDVNPPAARLIKQDLQSFSVAVAMFDNAVASRLSIHKLI